jgi:hypothetical protein
MKKYAVSMIIAAFFLVCAFSAEAINLKPDNPHDFKGNLTIDHGGKEKKIEDVRVMVSKEEINIIPGKKSGLPNRHIKAQKHDKYVDEKGQPVTVKVLDKTKGLIFTFANGEVYTFHKHDD